MNNAKITKMIKNVLFKNYLTDISEAAPYSKTLYRQFAFSGVIDPYDSIRLILIGDLAKWCSLKPANDLN